MVFHTYGVPVIKQAFGMKENAMSVNRPHHNYHFKYLNDNLRSYFQKSNEFSIKISNTKISGTNDYIL